MLKKLFERICSYIIYTVRRVFRPRVVCNHGVKISLGSHISDNIRKFIYMNAYEGDEISVLAQALCDEDKILEIGAGIGFISTYCAKRVGDENIIAYEANPDLVNVIKQTFTLNNISPIVHNKILSDKSGIQDFFVSDHFWSSSTIKRDSDFKKTQVETEDVNKVIKKYDVDFIIMDIEGGEAELLPKIDLLPIRKILLELHEDIIGDQGSHMIFRYLVNQGFKPDLLASKKEVLLFKKV